MQRFRKARHSFKMWALLLSLVMSISACSNRSSPAPVVNLSTKTATPQNLTEITTDTYTVERGDTLFAIAFYSGNDYRELAKRNDISAPYKLALGQTLVLRPQENHAIGDTTSPGVQSSAQANRPLIVAQNTRQTSREQSRPPLKSAAKKAKPQRTSPSNDELVWAWPAIGDRTVATVGSNGSLRGLDIKGKLGAKVVAAASGKVVYAGNALKGYGNLIIIKHNSEYLSAYAHNSAILVSEQTYVKQGQQIATMGNSGASEVMLHFEIRKKGNLSILFDTCL